MMPISVSCPGCGKEYNVMDEAAGKKFKCKECEAVVEVPAPSAANARLDDDFGEPENPFANLDIGGPVEVGAPVPQRRSVSSAGSGGRSSALERLAGPAVGMMITAGIGILANLGWGALMVIGMTMQPPGQNVGQAEMFLGLAVWGVILFVALILMCLVIYGALKMKRGESYGLAMAASILATIPCLTPCICMPFGIWGLVVLNDDAVKGAFR